MTTATKESRAEVRRILHCPVKVITKSGAVLRGRSLDVSLGGMSVMLNDAFDGAPQCVVSFEALAAGQLTNGKPVNVTVAAEAVYSICVGTSGFRVGFKFDRGNEAATKELHLLLG
jgi:hypothetical protein